VFRIDDVGNRSKRGIGMIFHVKRICARITHLKCVFCTDTVDHSIVVMVYKTGMIVYHDFGDGQP